MAFPKKTVLEKSEEVVEKELVAKVEEPKPTLEPEKVEIVKNVVTKKEKVVVKEEEVVYDLRDRTHEQIRNEASEALQSGWDEVVCTQCTTTTMVFKRIKYSK